MKKEQLINMGGKEYIIKSEIQPEDIDCKNRKIITHRFYFNDNDDILEVAEIEGFGQTFYFDIINNTWAGELCGYEIDKMNNFYK